MSAEARWLALHCAFEGCSERPGRSSPQEDEPWSIVARYSSGSMCRRHGTPLLWRLIGIHHGVSAQHLQAYLNEFTFRFNRRFYPFNAFRSLLGMAGGTEAPTFAELYSGDWAHPTCSGCLR
jgi:ISXO2-like transposase domain